MAAQSRKTRKFLVQMFLIDNFLVVMVLIGQLENRDLAMIRTESRAAKCLSGKKNVMIGVSPASC